MKKIPRKIRLLAESYAENINESRQYAKNGIKKRGLKITREGRNKK